VRWQPKGRHLYAICFSLFLVALPVSVVLAEDDSDVSKAIAKVESLWGKVTRDAALPGSPVVEVDFEPSRSLKEADLSLHDE
jgi:hypothetical protein